MRHRQRKPVVFIFCAGFETRGLGQAWHTSACPQDKCPSTRIGRHTRLLARRVREIFAAPWLASHRLKQKVVDADHLPHSFYICVHSVLARPCKANVHSQLSSSSVQVWESKGKRLKSMLQAAVTVTLSNETITVSQTAAGTHVRLEAGCHAVTHVQV